MRAREMVQFVCVCIAHHLTHFLHFRDGILHHVVAGVVAFDESHGRRYPIALQVIVSSVDCRGMRHFVEPN